jgi:probable HAF family extracellular repeat protein
MRRLAILPALVAAAAAAPLVSAASHARYRVSAVFKGGESQAFGLNEHGDIAGSISLEGHEHAAVRKSGRVTDLSRSITGFTLSRATALNDAGHVVGFGQKLVELTAEDTHQAVGSVPVQRALLWRGQGLQELAAGMAESINRRDEVVGYSPQGTGFFWRHGEVVRLADDELGLQPHAINEAGQIAGATIRLAGSGRSHDAFLSTVADERPVYSLLNVGYTGGAFPAAFCINAAGHVAGVGGGFDGVAFLRGEEKLVPLGTMNGPAVVGDLGQHVGYHFSVAYGINDRDQVVGAANVADDGSHLHAFVWENGRLSDLNTLLPEKSGWVLQEARDINNRGQICGTGLLLGRRQAFLLTPQR